MWTGSISPADVQAAEVLTGGAMALWLALGYAPGRLRRHAGVARAGLLIVYLAGCAGVFLHAVLR